VIKKVNFYICKGKERLKDKNVNVKSV